jgi:hypothetical protein
MLANHLLDAEVVGVLVQAILHQRRGDLVDGAAVPVLHGVAGGVGREGSDHFNPDTLLRPVYRKRLIDSQPCDIRHNRKVSDSLLLETIFVMIAPSLPVDHQMTPPSTDHRGNWGIQEIS